MPSKQSGSEAIKVVFRVRPLSNREIQDGRKQITIAHEDRGVIEIKNPDANESEPAKQFTFDAVFSGECTQKHLYDVCAAPVVQAVLEGYNGTVFAYGQTGAGKTHTMEGVTDCPELRGIIPNAFQHIFDHVALKGSDEKYLVRSSYFEIYNEEIRDLLSKTPKNNLGIKESSDSGVYIKGLTSTVVKSVKEIEDVMKTGAKYRSVGATKMNKGSSRSHSVFTIVVECCRQDSVSGEEHIRVGKLNLVDLAGSERQAKTGATGDRLKEATKINLSLSALGNVISALVDGKSQHIPYRDSKLTRILQDSLGGNTKTVMCANAGPANYNYDETISTLRYANRAKNIKNKPIINEDPKDAMLREYQDEISKLKDQLASLKVDTQNPLSPNITFSTEENEHNKNDFEEQSILHEVKLKEMKERADKEKEKIKAQSYEEIERLKNEHNREAKERKELESKLEQESKTRAEEEEQRLLLRRKLQDMEAQLMIGGEMASKAAKHEAALRKAEQDLVLRKEKELILARQMSEQEELNLELEEKHSSLSDEVQSKTKKLKKLWIKYQQAKTEIDDLQSEFQCERNDLLDDIREITKQLKLKEFVIDNFIPSKYAKLFDDEQNGGIAKWDNADESWSIPNIDLAHKHISPRLGSTRGLSRPESEYARQRKMVDKDVRWRYENVIQLDLIMPEKSTQKFDGRNTANNINYLLDMDLNDYLMKQTPVHSSDGTGNPYLRLSNDISKKGEDKRLNNRRPSSSRGFSRSSKRRPSTARY